MVTWFPASCFVHCIHVHTHTLVLSIRVDCSLQSLFSPLSFPLFLPILFSFPSLPSLPLFFSPLPPSSLSPFFLFLPFHILSFPPLPPFSLFLLSLSTIPPLTFYLHPSLPPFLPPLLFSQPLLLTKLAIWVASVPTAVPQPRPSGDETLRANTSAMHVDYTTVSMAPIVMGHRRKRWEDCIAVVGVLCGQDTFGILPPLSATHMDRTIWEVIWALVDM